MEHHEGSFAGHADAGGRALQLFFQGWRPHGEARSAVAIVHGFAEHSGRYGFLVDHLVARGHAVYGFDLRGFGRSPGRRGHIDDWAEYRGDVGAFLAEVRKSGLPVFLLGHSMGGLIVLDYGLRRPEDLAGAIVSAPGLRPVGAAKPHLVAIARFLSRIWPTFSLDLGLDPTAISRDPEVVEAYLDDPLRHPRGTVRWGTESLAAIRRIKAHATEWTLPLLMVHGEDDRIAAASGTRAFFERVPIADKELHVYEGGYHEPHNDVDRDRALGDVADWLERHLQVSPA